MMRQAESLRAQAQDGIAVTPADSDFADNDQARWLYVGGAGNLRVTTVQGTDLTFTAVSAGTQLYVSVRRVWATGTTATSILALW